jgi:hypothetical protein
MDDWTRGREGPIRLGLAALVIPAAWVGLWAAIAPRSFYDDFPGWSDWVAPLGPYDEHLVRDVGAFQLGLLTVAVLALVTLDRRLVQAAALAAVVSGIPHLVYHLTTTGSLSTADNAVSLFGLAAPPLVALALLSLTGAARTRA